MHAQQGALERRDRHLPMSAAMLIATVGLLSPNLPPSRSASLRGGRVALSELKPKPGDRPGNFVQPYTSALGVSAAAILCGELIPIPGSADTAVPLLGRVAACTSLPLLCTAFVVLRAAAKVGPPMLRTVPYQRLNLGVAVSSVSAVVVAPMPIISVIVARAGSALLCLEIWSQGSEAKSGDPLAEITAVVKSVVASVRRALTLLFGALPARRRAASSLEGNGAGAVDATGPAGFAALFFAYCGLAVAALAAPPAATAALWPAVAPGMGSARTAVSTALLSAVCALSLGDVAASRQPSSTGDELRPWRWLNRALLASASAHVALQALAAGLSLRRGGLALAASPLGASASAALLGACASQLVHIATIALCATQEQLFFS